MCNDASDGWYPGNMKPGDRSPPRMGKLLDLTSRLPPRCDHPPPTDVPALFGPPAPEDHPAPDSRPRILGQRPDGTIDLAAWRARWHPIFAAEFVMDLGRGQTTPEGSLRFFHDPRSSSLEFLAQDHEGRTIRHVLQPVDAMRLVVALNGAYGFDPEGPGGKRLSEWDDGRGGPGPMTA